MKGRKKKGSSKVQTNEYINIFNFPNGMNYDYGGLFASRLVMMQISNYF